MDMDNEQTSPSNLVKWPFFASAVFILGFVLYFALNRPPDEPLDQWQLATCVLSSALACILIFLPYLLEKFLELALNPSADREEQLIQKIYFELKELRDDLGKLGVKVEKVPALVDKIVSESSGNDDAAFSEAVKLGGELEALRKEIGERFDALRKPLEDAAAPQPDVALSTIPDAIDDIRERIEETLTAVQAIKPAKRKASQKKEPEPEEDTPAAEPEPEPLAEEQSQTESETEPETETEPEPEEEAVNEEPEPESEPSEEEASEEEAEPGTPETEEKAKAEIEEPVPEKEPETEELPDDGEEDEPDEPEQAELDLPDPAETLRKVDAILEETNPDRAEKPKKAEPEEPTSETSDNGGATAVVAKVKIGIGNKPFLRGEGPGLSWEEGVPMNFVEIGKWAWSPSDKDAPLVVQVYRNDEDPDPTGKHEVEPGQKLELSPDFPE
ncbi:MAG: hypothetical protein HOA16_12115 [Opitutae bacterium]|nr:hypothetical protein [Opitutae bacterium]